jgi:hypothetical protein
MSGLLFSSCLSTHCTRSSNLIELLQNDDKSQAKLGFIFLNFKLFLTFENKINKRSQVHSKTGSSNRTLLLFNVPYQVIEIQLSKKKSSRHQKKTKTNSEKCSSSLFILIF